MDKVDEYRECAAECLRLAMRARAHEKKLILLELSDPPPLGSRRR
jgi:hypothetical protein